MGCVRVAAITTGEDDRHTSHHVPRPTRSPGWWGYREGLPVGRDAVAAQSTVRSSGAGCRRGFLGRILPGQMMDLERLDEARVIGCEITR